MPPRLFRLVLAAVGFASVALRILVPPNPIYNSFYDDELMIRFANNLLDGKWLGDYAELGHAGLAKPPGYAFFLVLTAWMPWSPTVSVHILLLAGFLLVARELRHLGLSRTLVTFFFTFAAFYPAWFNEPASRLYRDGFLAALSSVAVGLALLLHRQLSLGTTESHSGSRVLGVVRRLITPSALGLFLGWFVITKNSWHFLVIAVVAILLSLLLRQNLRSRHFLLTLLGSFAAMAVVAGGVIGGVIVKNHTTYGVAALDTYTQGPFAEAMKIMYSVEDLENRPYVDITFAMREKMYAVSPTMTKLRPFLERPTGDGWRGTSCASAMQICDESGAWFPWDLRAAVQDAGLGPTAKDFNNTFAQIARELDTACENETLTCESNGLAPGLDSLDSLSPRVVTNAVMYGIGELMNPDSGRSDRPVSQDVTPSQYEQWARVVKGLPPVSMETNYTASTFFLSDARRALGQIYRPLWPLFGILSVAAIALRGVRSARRNSLLGIALYVSSLVFVFQLSLIEASSGVYMIPGGSMYMLCLYPLIFTGAALGMSTIRKSADDIL